MNAKLEKWKQSLKDKKVCVVGIGISHLPLIEYLARLGVSVSACDKRTKEEMGETATRLEALGVTLFLGEDYLSRASGDVIFKTPGLRPDAPELLAAQANGALLTSEMEVFFELCPAPIIAVTGSDGKTTTTTLIYEMLSTAGFNTHVGGNIGKPLLPEIDSICKSDRVVLELSSFQLMTMKQSPQVAVITNITPNHLNWHTDYAEYIDAKLNLMRYQNAEDMVVLNADNEETAKVAEKACGRVRTFSRQGAGTVSLVGNQICIDGEAVLDVNDIRIPGKHNIENYMAAIAATYPAVSKEQIVSVAKEFGGVAHRIELVRVLDGVRYYNSSIDSSPNRTKNTLSVFTEPVVLIAGGQDKKIPYDDLGPAICEHVKCLVLIGETASAIAKAAEKDAPHVPVFYPKTYEDAVLLAKEKASAGDVVILSNASTSFDMFKNFEERGNLFKDLVNRL